MNNAILIKNFKPHIPFAVVVWLFLVMLLWLSMVDRHVSFISLVFLATVPITFFLTGDLFVKIVLKNNIRFNTISIKILIGILFVNLLLFLLCLLSVFGFAANWLFLVIFITISSVINNRVHSYTNLVNSDYSENIFLFLSPLIITIWCLDSLQPLQINADFMLLRAWPDIFFHLSQISGFSHSTGFNTLSDTSMIEAPVHPYHMATYMLPAVLVNVTGVSTLTAYSSMLVPIGLFSTSLAAFSIIRLAFGHWPSLIAGLSILLIPDAAQQGFGNTFLSYHWLQQIAPAQMYGIASAAFAFMFLIEGSRFKQYGLIFLGYFFVFVTLLFKAQIFVAISYLALIYPVLFLRNIKIHYRIFFLLLMTCIYVAAVFVGQTSNKIPTMRLDGSALDAYSSLILSLASNAYIKDIFYFLFNTFNTYFLLKAFSFMLLLILCTFGFSFFIYIFVCKRLSTIFEPGIWVIPFLVIFVYLTMSTFLAFDKMQIGTPEELLHRPFVWAYFIVISWTTGGLYFYLFGDSIPSNKIVKFLLIFLFFMLMSITVYFSNGIHYAEGLGSGKQSIPKCLLNTAIFIKKMSNSNEVVQDANNDPKFILSALSERRAYAIDTSGFRMPIGLLERLSSLNDLKQFSDSDEVYKFMKNTGINWYVTHSNDNVKWSSKLHTNLIFSCGDYKTFVFNN